MPKEKHTLTHRKKRKPVLTGRGLKDFAKKAALVAAPIALAIAGGIAAKKLHPVYQHHANMRANDFRVRQFERPVDLMDDMVPLDENGDVPRYDNLRRWSREVDQQLQLEFMRGIVMSNASAPPL